MTEERGAWSANSTGSAKGAKERPPWDYDVRVERPASVRSIFVEQEAFGGGRATKGVTAAAGGSATVSVAAAAYGSTPFVLVADDRSIKTVPKSFSSDTVVRSKSPAKLERAKSIYTQRLTQFNHMIDSEYLASVTQTLSLSKSNTQTDPAPHETNGGGNIGVIAAKDATSGDTSTDRLGDSSSSDVRVVVSSQSSISKPDDGTSKTAKTSEVLDHSPSTVEQSKRPEETSSMTTPTKETPKDDQPKKSASTQAQSATDNAIKVTDGESNETIIQPDVLAKMNAVGLKPTYSPLLKAKPPPTLPPGTNSAKTSLLAVGTVSTPTTKRKANSTKGAGKNPSESKSPEIVPEPQNLFGVSPTPSRGNRMEPTDAGIFVTPRKPIA